MDARLLDVLHDRTDQHLAAGVPQGVDVDLGGVLQEPVDEHRALGRQPALAPQGAEPGQLGHGPGQPVVVVHDLHRSPSEDVRRAHERWVADAGRDGQRRLKVGGRTPVGLRDAEPGAQRVPPLTVLGFVDGGGRRPEHQLGRDATGKLQRGLAAQRDHDPGEPAGSGGM